MENSACPPVVLWQLSLRQLLNTTMAAPLFVKTLLLLLPFWKTARSDNYRIAKIYLYIVLTSRFTWSGAIAASQVVISVAIDDN